MNEDCFDCPSIEERVPEDYDERDVFANYGKEDDMLVTWQDDKYDDFDDYVDLIDNE